MNRNQSNAFDLMLAGLLTAMAILIPIIMPFKIIIGPASYTLASHVPIMMAMFHSPKLAVITTIGSSIGFLFAGFPIVVAFRALSHLIFVYLGSRYLMAHPNTLTQTSRRYLFSIAINLLHGLAEIVVVVIFTALGISGQTDNYYYTIFVLIGLGTFIHGLIDFEFTYQFTKLLARRANLNFSRVDL